MRRSTSQDVSSRDLEDTVVAVAHGIEPNSSSPMSDSPLVQNMTGAGGERSDGPSAGSVVAWSPAGAAAPPASSVNPTDGMTRLDSRPGAAAPMAIAQPLGSMVLLISGPELAGPMLERSGSIPDDRGDTRMLSSIAPADPDGDAGGPVWTELLEGALCADWDAVDGELRQFLARLSGLADASSGRDAWRVGRLWIAAAAALVLARRRSSRRRQLVRRSLAGADRDSVRGALPIGPWPLGPL